MKKRMKLIFSLALLLMLAGCGKTNAPENTYQQITQEEAARLMVEQTDYVLLDVRTQAEYDEGHIPGAVCIPNETIGTEKLPELPRQDQLILVYCRSGNRSKQAAQKLASMGYTNVREFGGINTWTGETVSGSEG